jgi:ParB family chromosome partitioning protein
VVREMTDDEAARYALVENLQREDLNPLEETEGVLRLLSMALDRDAGDVVALLYAMDYRRKRASAHNVMGDAEEETVFALFEGLDKMTWSSFVKNRLPLLKLPGDVLEALRSGSIAYTKARVVARLKDDEPRSTLLREAIEQDLPLSVVRARVDELLGSRRRGPAARDDLAARASSLARRLGRSGVLGDREKRERLQALLAQMEALLDA